MKLPLIAVLIIVQQRREAGDCAVLLLMGNRDGFACQLALLLAVLGHHQQIALFVVKSVLLEIRLHQLFGVIARGGFPSFDDALLAVLADDAHIL